MNNRLCITINGCGQKIAIIEKKYISPNKRIFWLQQKPNLIAEAESY